MSENKSWIHSQGQRLTRQTSPENLIQYVSHAERYDLVQKLGAIEHRSEGLINRTCDHICRFPYEADQEELDDICKECPITKLAELIGV